MSEEELTPNSGDHMMSCPKCGFDQPVDQYCAKCGVDMPKALKKSSGLAGLIKNPAAIAGVIVLLGGIGFVAYRGSRTQGLSDGQIEVLGLTSQERAKSHLSAKASNQITKNIEIAESAQLDSLNQEGAEAESQPPALAATPLATAPYGASSGAPTAPPGGKSTAKESAASRSEGILVVFAWAEVSREWLQSISAAEHGFHQVPGLENRLRQSAGSFRIFDVTRRRLTEDAEPVVITRGEQSVYFEPLSVKPKSLTGGFTAQYKTAQGEVRAPATATASLLHGTGAIVPMGPSTTTEGTEIVVFILPRWGND